MAEDAGEASRSIPAQQQSSSPIDRSAITAAAAAAAVEGARPGWGRSPRRGSGSEGAPGSGRTALQDADPFAEGSLGKLFDAEK